jgi:hypothetical protein
VVAQFSAMIDGNSDREILRVCINRRALSADLRLTKPYDYRLRELPL